MESSVLHFLFAVSTNRGLDPFYTPVFSGYEWLWTLAPLAYWWKLFYLTDFHLVLKRVWSLPIGTRLMVFLKGKYIWNCNEKLACSCITICNFRELHIQRVPYYYVLYFGLIIAVAYIHVLILIPHIIFYRNEWISALFCGIASILSPVPNTWRKRRRTSCHLTKNIRQYYHLTNISPLWFHFTFISFANSVSVLFQIENKLGIKRLG